MQGGVSDQVIFLFFLTYSYFIVHPLLYFFYHTSWRVDHHNAQLYRRLIHWGREFPAKRVQAVKRQALCQPGKLAVFAVPSNAKYQLVANDHPLSSDSTVPGKPHC
jgi:hypothetical protein